MKRATLGSNSFGDIQKDFNPRPREEGDEYILRLKHSLIISIHALVKRATEFLTKNGYLSDISIHALVKRATKLISSSSYSVIDFNPRPREEGDPCSANNYTPVYDFNPRPREEGDFCCKICCFCHDISIHALVKRATHRPTV